MQTTSQITMFDATLNKGRGVIMCGLLAPCERSVKTANWICVSFEWICVSFERIITVS